MRECSDSFHKFVKEAMIEFVRKAGKELHSGDNTAFCPMCGGRLDMKEYVVEDEDF